METRRVNCNHAPALLISLVGGRARVGRNAVYLSVAAALIRPGPGVEPEWRVGPATIFWERPRGWGNGGHGFGIHGIGW